MRANDIGRLFDTMRCVWPDADRRRSLLSGAYGGIGRKGPYLQRDSYGGWTLTNMYAVAGTRPDE